MRKPNQLISKAWAFALLPLILCQCTPEEGVVDMECFMGYPNLVSASYDEFQTGDDAEIVLGFQGFVFTRLMLRIPSEFGKIPKVDVDLFIKVEGKEEFGGTQLGVDFTSMEESEDSLSEEMYLYLSPAIVAQFKDRDAVISLDVRGERHFCSVSQNLRLVDSDPCIHTGGISFICPEDEE
jgi:hypothetical protein